MSEANLRLLLSGAGAAALSMLLLRRGRRPTGALLGVVGPALALFTTGWWGWPHPPAGRLMGTVLVGLAAGAGYERLARAGPVSMAPLVLLASCGGVWLAVPENSPVAAVIGVALTLWVVGRATDPGTGYGLALAAAWTVLLGGRSNGYSFDGGLLCLAPLVAVAALGHVRGGRLPAWPWFVVGAGAVSFVAARWVGVAPDATWARVVAVAAGAGVLAAIVRR